MQLSSRTEIKKNIEPSFVIVEKCNHINPCQTNTWGLKKPSTLYFWIKMTEISKLFLKFRC